MLRPFVVRYAVVEGRGKSPKECVRTHTESCDDKHFPKVGLDSVEGRSISPKEYRRGYLPKVELLCRRNILGATK